MEAQWQPNLARPNEHNGPSFRRGEYVAASVQDEAQLHWHVFRVRDDGSLEQLDGERSQRWNSAESVEFPLQWANGVIASAGQ